jgi:DNA polymerase-3 subunit epsilon
MVDAEMTSHLWLRMQSEIASTHAIGDVDHALLSRLQAVPRAQVPRFLHDAKKMQADALPC